MSAEQPEPEVKSYNEVTGEKNAGYYLNAIRENLPKDVFDRAPLRILWLPVHLIIIGLLWWALLTLSSTFIAKIGIAVLIGHSFGCLMFVGHELIHESILKRGRLQSLSAWICFLPYWISPEQWRTWHNHWHHRNTSLPAMDPDAWGNLDTYLKRKEFRAMEPLAPGSGSWKSIFFFGYWFGFQGLLVMTVFSRLFHYWSDRERKLLWLQFALCGVIWGSVAVVMGWSIFLYAYFLPMIVANLIQMAYIATNHLMMPETKDCNDPLLNTLSVRTFRIFDFFHLNFSHHIEHHVAPSISPRHAPAIRKALINQFGGRFKELPHWQALKLLYQTPKLHWDANHLINPRTGAIFQVIGLKPTPVFIGSSTIPIPRARRDTKIADVLTPTIKATTAH